MKRLNQFLVILVALLLLFSCASSGKTQKSKNAVQLPVMAGDIQTISKYGNCYSTISVKEGQAKGYNEGDIISVTINGKVIEMPIGTSYSDVDVGSYIARCDYANDVYEFAINHGNFMNETGATLGTEVSFTMADKGGYMEEYLIRHLVKSEDRKAYASDEVFANFREVDEGDIDEGILYRGCNPVYGDARAPYADKLIKKAKIKTVINLADTKESIEKNLKNAPNYKSLYNKGSVISLNMGVDFADPEFTNKLREGLIFMATHKGPYYIHCNEGKDRAGFVIAFLEALCGASIEEITEDYMESFENYYGTEPGSVQYAEISKNVASFLSAINGGKMPKDKELKKVASNYAVKTIGLTEAQVKAIIKNLT